MITCQELVAITTDYLEGKLSLSDRLRFQLHLGMCRNCRTWLAQMEQTVETLGRLEVSAPPAGVREELLARFRRWAPSPGSARGPRS